MGVSKRLSILSIAFSFCLVNIGDALGQVANAPRIGEQGAHKVIPGGLVEVSYEDGIVKRFDDLLDSALSQDPTSAKLDQAVSHYRKTKQKVSARAKDALNTVVPYSGFSHSSELADLIADDRVKLKSRSAVELARQKHIDAKHLELTNSLMEIATIVGDPAPRHTAAVPVLKAESSSSIAHTPTTAVSTTPTTTVGTTPTTTVGTTPTTTEANTTPTIEADTTTKPAVETVATALAPAPFSLTSPSPFSAESSQNAKAKLSRSKKAAQKVARKVAQQPARQPVLQAISPIKDLTVSSKATPSESMEDLTRLLEDKPPVVAVSDKNGSSESGGTAVSEIGAANGDSVDAVQQLAQLVGQQKANDTLEFMKKWDAEVSVPDEVFAEATWSPRQQQAKFQIAYEAALQQDAVIKQVRERINKYNHMSAGKRVTGHVLETVLGVASFAPNIAGPAAQVGLVAFEQSTGGSEESKVMKEVYLSKRLESRARVLSEEAHLALMNYQLGLVNHNKLQLLYGELLINDLCGADACGKIFARPVVTGVLRRQFSSLRPHNQDVAERPKTGQKI